MVHDGTSIAVVLLSAGVGIFRNLFLVASKVVVLEMRQSRYKWIYRIWNQWFHPRYTQML